MENRLIESEHHHSESADVFGFWIYILSDCILFATLFAVFSVLRNNYFGTADIIKFTNIFYILIETVILLTSSFTFGLSIMSFYKNKLKSVINWLIVTFLLGIVFVWMEVSEFINVYRDGFGWQTSAAMSAFFTLVGTHGLHVSLGLIWMTAIIYQLNQFGLNDVMKRRMIYLGLFWAFLDIIWIFVFTIVYLIGIL